MKKWEIVALVAGAAFAGFAAGYSKAREICLQAIIIATGKAEEKEVDNKEES